MRDILLTILQEDTTYNKSATRYLSKNYPELWQEVLTATSFLPETAQPKQRVWHVVNDIWSIPTCPVTGAEVKWWENRYLGTLDRSARATQCNRLGKTKNQTAAAKEKRIASIKKNTAAGLRKLPTLTDETKAQRSKKIKSTCMDKYGVSNPSKTHQSRKKISDCRIKNGATPLHLRTLRRIYYDVITKFTKESWASHFDKINPTRINRSANSLDHIYSVQQGFRDNIPPYVIGHWTNLRMMPLGENSAKGMRCDKTQDELFSDFFSGL